MKVKICGIKSFDHASRAVELGVELLGFNFYPPSPRYIQPDDCRRIVSLLKRMIKESGREVKLVGVFVNATKVEILRILDLCGLDLAQLCGEEPPELLEELGDRAFKALRPSTAIALDEDLRRYPKRSAAPAWLVDAYRPGAYGGTGQPADWGLARTLARQSQILLAGGLNPQNVREAIRQVQPWGVDVASGVESSPGRMDTGKLVDFVHTVRAV